MSPFDPNSNQRSSGNGGFSRIIFALIIALLGWIMYMSHTEVNPVTQEKQHVAISPSQEIRLGLESAPQMAREMGGEVPASDPRAAEVQKIGNYLVAHTIAHNSPWKFQFHLLADPQTVNAFALPGGQVFITLGLYDKLQNEAQLAGVLGHEMGHVIERHSAEQMAKNQLGQSLIVAVGTAASSQSSNGNNMAAIAAFVNQAIQLRYSRKDESEADIWGLKLMSSAGFNPEAMLDVMKILKAASRGNPGIEIFQSHPNPDLRMKQIEAYVEKNKPASGLSEGERLPQ